MEISIQALSKADVFLKVQKCHENAVMWDMCFFGAISIEVKGLAIES